MLLLPLLKNKAKDSAVLQQAAMTIMKLAQMPFAWKNENQWSHFL